MSQEKQLNFKMVITPILTILLSIIYIAISTVEIKAGDFSLVWDMSLRIIIILIFGMSISSLCSEIGYILGKKDPEYLETRRTAVDFSTQILPDKYAAELYTSDEIDKKIMLNRTAILNGAGLKYTDIFNTDGTVIKYSKKELKDKHFDRKQKRAIRKSQHIVKKAFSLLAYSEADSVGLEITPSETLRRSKKLTTSLITRIITACVSGTILVKWLGWSPEQLIYTLMQIGLWLGSGAVDAYGNYNYITVTIRDYDKSRIGYMKAFLALPDFVKHSYRIKSGWVEEVKNEQLLSNEIK